MRPKFHGTYTAIVTPFLNNEVDFDSLNRLIDTQIKGKVEGVVPVGTTGESPTLSTQEHIDVIRATVHKASGKLKVIAGTGANSTKEAIDLTKAAESAGADASLQVAPYYNRPTQEGLFQHFSAIAENTKLPIILYSIPSRCGVEISVETVARLASSHRNIVGIKEAGGNVDRVSQIKQALGNDFTILSGDDGLTVPFLSVGAHGVISVASNIIPKQVGNMVRAYLSGDTKKAATLHHLYYPVFKDLFLETNPAPVKAALAALKIITDGVRLPLVDLTETNRRRLFQTLRDADILNA